MDLLTSGIALLSVLGMERALPPFRHGAARVLARLGTLAEVGESRVDVPLQLAVPGADALLERLIAALGPQTLELLRGD